MYRLNHNNLCHISTRCNQLVRTHKSNSQCSSHHGCKHRNKLHPHTCGTLIHIGIRPKDSSCPSPVCRGTKELEYKLV
ncbi:hypothetical protein DPMN_179427 [Dreissena polymorpha]|uniref:Uncharacterized protein n=1 Tax=Dreissena polymorpha TaxID=45954 RepID=A0A9D4EDZ2_DREPO|nr:hypothetical protein DPMN_179427 [Dreissena polymorpha]